MSGMSGINEGQFKEEQNQVLQRLGNSLSVSDKSKNAEGLQRNNTALRL